MEKQKQELVLFEGELLTVSQDRKMLERRNLLGKTILRRARYWCFRFRNEATGGAAAEDAPAGFKEFVESLGGFAGWDKFAETWDIVGHNPFMVVFRLMSVWQEWDHVMERVAIPIDATPLEAKRRQNLLAKQYKG
jgi:hypothetical protein